MGLEILTEVVDEDQAVEHGPETQVERVLATPVLVRSKKDNPSNALEIIEQFLYEFPLESANLYFGEIRKKHPKDEVHLHKRGALVTIRSKPSESRMDLNHDGRVPKLPGKKGIPSGMDRADAFRLANADWKEDREDDGFDYGVFDYEDTDTPAKKKSKKKKRKGAA